MSKDLKKMKEGTEDICGRSFQTAKRARAKALEVVACLGNVRNYKGPALLKSSEGRGE